MKNSDSRARRITRQNSLLTYLIILFLCDRNLINECFKAYAYFRWLDDEVDENIKSFASRRRFIARQKNIIDSYYSGCKVKNLAAEERMIAELIATDTGQNLRLKSFIKNFFAIVEFDVSRRGKTLCRRELTWYSKTLGVATTDCIQYFIGNKNSYPNSKYKYSGATAAHIVHMFRDYKEDQRSGYFNFDINSKHARKLLSLARKYFCENRKYIREIHNFRCKIASYIYTLKFERTLAQIENEYS